MRGRALVVALISFGSPAAGPLLAAAPKAPVVTVEASVSRQGADRANLRIDATIAEGWHVNSHKPSEDYLIPTAITLDPASGARFGEPQYPDGVQRKFAFSETPLSVYEKRFSIQVAVTLSGKAPDAFAGTLAYQACNDSQCNPPASAGFRAAVPEGSSAPAALAGGAVALSEGPRGPGESSTRAPGGAGDFGALLERRGLLWALLVAFGWGLALNLTPCVYPVIPLTVSFFGGQTSGREGHVLRLAALYVLGMATMYSALGVAAALSGKLFGLALQSPWVLAGVAVVLVGLALSMFGVYEIRMPSAWMQKAGARSGGAGAYAMGLLVGVVAAPCVGPAVLALLAFVATRQDPAFGFLVFFVLSLGLGLPYLFLALFSGSLSRLPRAGEWMEQVKKIFGWALLAMAAYFLRTVLAAPWGPWLLPATLALGAVALLMPRSRSGRPARLAAAVLFLAAAAFLLPRRLPASAAPVWAPYTPEAVSQAGRPAVIDFSATWCIPCLELDRETFSDTRVRSTLERRALFKADMTRSDEPQVVALAERFRILGVPTVIFLDASGKEREDLRLVGFEKASDFLKRLEQAP